MSMDEFIIIFALAGLIFLLKCLIGIIYLCLLKIDKMIFKLVWKTSLISIILASISLIVFASINRSESVNFYIVAVLSMIIFDSLFIFRFSKIIISKNNVFFISMLMNIISFLIVAYFLRSIMIVLADYFPINLSN